MQHPAGTGPRGALAALGIALAFTAGSAAAQEAAAPADDAAVSTVPVEAAPAAAEAVPEQAPDSPQRLEEIVVTATKRDQSVRDIPASITALKGDELQQRNAQNTQDIIKLVPGANYSADNLAPGKVTIRGISGAPTTGFTVGVLFGDVSFIDLSMPISSLDPNPFDLETVEVLKGPQGTLFGASALNGAVRYVPKAPQPGVWQAEYYVDYSQYVDSAWAPNYGAVINAPMGETAALRVMGFSRESPGYIDDVRTGVKDANSIDQTGGRIMFGWTPLEDLDMQITYARQMTDVQDAVLVDNPNGELKTSVSPRPSPSNVNYSLTDLNLGYPLSFAKLVSETALVRKASHIYSESSHLLEGLLPSVIEPGSIPLLAIVAGGHSDTVSQELRLVSLDDGESPWRWVGGVFWQRQRVNLIYQLPLGDSTVPTDILIPILRPLIPTLVGGNVENGVINGQNSESNVRIVEKAAFADVTRSLWEDWELTVGARFYETESDGYGYKDGVLVLAGDRQPRVVTSGQVSGKGVNPKASLSWRITPDVLAYAMAAKGFRIGGFQTGSTLPYVENAAPTTYKSDTIWNYELGARTDFFDKTLRFDITAFLAQWDNPQYQVKTVSGLSTYMSNVGSVESKGIEAALQMLLPIPGLMFSLSGYYGKTVTTAPFENSDGSIAPTGSPWPFAPKLQTATTLAYITDVGSLNLRSMLTHTYLGEAINNLEQQSPIFNYQQWDASVAVSKPASRWLPEVSLTVNNLMDERGVVNHIYSESPLPFENYTYIPPRRVTLRLSGKF